MNEHAPTPATPRRPWNPTHLFEHPRLVAAAIVAMAAMIVLSAVQ